MKYPVPIEEIATLRRDLDEFFARVNGPQSTDRSWAGYDSNEMLGYLTEERLSFYRELMAICDERNIGFEGKRIADAGTYLGYLPRLILSSIRNCHITGFDLDERSLGLARHLCPACEFLVFDPLRDPGPYAGRFDLVFCTEVLEHVTDPEGSLARLCRLLKPEGALILTVPNGRLDHGEAGIEHDGICYSGHINFWSPESWKGFLRKNVPGTFEAGLMSGGDNFAVVQPNAAALARAGRGAADG